MEKSSSLFLRSPPHRGFRTAAPPPPSALKRSFAPRIFRRGSVIDGGWRIYFQTRKYGSNVFSFRPTEVQRDAGFIPNMLLKILLFVKGRWAFLTFELLANFILLIFLFCLLPFPFRSIGIGTVRERKFDISSSTRWCCGAFGLVWHIFYFIIRMR